MGFYQKELIYLQPWLQGGNNQLEYLLTGPWKKVLGDIGKDGKAWCFSPVLIPDWVERGH